MRQISRLLVAAWFVVCLLAACDSSTPPAGFDAGPAPTEDPCAPVLADFCGPIDGSCPTSYNEFRQTLCEQQPSPAPQRADNSCGGGSVSIDREEGTTQYHFDRDNRLIGVTVLGAAAPGCSGSSRKYGVGCSLTGEESRFCGCTAQGCVSSAVFRLDAPADAVWMGAVAELCRNDGCVRQPIDSGRLPPSEDVPLVTTRLSDGLAIRVSYGAGAQPYITVRFSTSSQAIARNGDRFRFTLQRDGAAEVVLLDQAVSTFEQVGDETCQVCLQAEIDLRTDTQSDAGSANDDAGR